MCVIPLTFFFSGCISGVTTNLQKEGVLFERDGVTTILLPSDTREAYFKDPQSFERHCRAPGPDVSIQSSSGISLGASIIGKSEEISDTSGQTGLALGGRDPAVLLTRELMYRACELVSNLNADKKTTIDIYNRFLTTVEKAIKMQQLVGTATASSTAKSALQNIVLQNQQEPNTTVTTNTNTTTTSIEKSPINTSSSTTIAQNTASSLNTYGANSTSTNFSSDMSNISNDTSTDTSGTTQNDVSTNSDLETMNTNSMDSASTADDSSSEDVPF